MDYTKFFNGARNTIVMKKYSYMLFKYCLCKLISSWSFWLFVLFIVCSYLSAMFQTTITPNESKHLYSCLTVFSNVSFGYIAGYIFYIVSDFIPQNKSEFQALQKILFAEYEILMSSIVFELYKLGEPVGEEEQDYETHNKKFVIMLCEKNPYEQCEDESIRIMSYWKISNAFVDITNTFKKSSSVYFDLLLGSQSKYLSYDELESITKMKRCLSLDFAVYKNGYFSAKLAQINDAFNDLYKSKESIVHQLKQKSNFCVDQELALKILML